MRERKKQNAIMDETDKDDGDFNAEKACRTPFDLFLTDAGEQERTYEEAATTLVQDVLASDSSALHEFLMSHLCSLFWATRPFHVQCRKRKFICSSELKLRLS